jgi:hypothetical protein
MGEPLRQEITETTLKAGEHQTISIVWAAPISYNDFNAYHHRQAELCVTGRITYIDGAGTVRQTGFFRAYDPVRLHFLRADEHDYEYED